MRRTSRRLHLCLCLPTLALSGLTAFPVPSSTKLWEIHTSILPPDAPQNVINPPPTATETGCTPLQFRVRIPSKCQTKLGTSRSSQSHTSTGASMPSDNHISCEIHPAPLAALRLGPNFTTKKRPPEPQACKSTPKPTGKHYPSTLHS